MRELPILFSTPMVQAIQAGTKNQTRRTAGLEKVNENPDEWKVTKDWSDKGVLLFNKNGFSERMKSRYQKGDKIWVKETFTVLEPEHFYDGMKSRFVYKADCDLESEHTRKEYVLKGWPYQWKPSLFMPKEASRLWLEVTEVRCERLQDISEQDAIGEGIEKLGIGYLSYTKNTISLHAGAGAAYRSYISLWESINGKDSWLDNPWVFIYYFKVIEKP